MSDIHFVANEIYKKRVKQLGENEKYIFNVGGLGVDQIDKNSLFSNAEIQKITKIKLRKKII